MIIKYSSSQILIDKFSIYKFARNFVVWKLPHKWQALKNAGLQKTLKMCWSKWLLPWNQSTNSCPDILSDDENTSCSSYSTKTMAVFVLDMGHMCSAKTHVLLTKLNTFLTPFNETEAYPSPIWLHMLLISSKSMILWIIVDGHWKLEFFYA